jgi:gamma-glutamyltranspeptidase/glutathione hydrolase
MDRVDWTVRKHMATGRRGMVAAKHPMATAAGLAMFDRGGNAVDAAVAAAFCSGVVEPMMSGVGGGGFMVIHTAAHTTVLDYNMQAPLAARADFYPLEAGYTSGDLQWAWRQVPGDANLHGPRSVAVPGAVPGLALALERFGRLDLSTVLEPAIAAADGGFPIDWMTTLRIAVDAQTLRRFPAAAAIFLEDGLAPAPARSVRPRRLRQPDLAQTLRRLARHGPALFTTGEIARTMSAEVQRAGGVLSMDDLAGYTPRLLDPLTLAYHGWSVATVPGRSGGPTLAAILRGLESFDHRAHGHGTAGAIDAFARAALPAFTERYAGAPPAAADESTTHVSTADHDGGLVTLTQTHLGAFGSRFVVPGTGIVLNNGMYWFDPEPGRPASIVPGERAPANMAPLVVWHPGRAAYAIGSSGGRRIICCNAQILLNLVDYGMDLQAALEAPRVDASGDALLVDDRIGGDVITELRARGFAVETAEASFYPIHFASPAATGQLAGDGRLVGATDPFNIALAQGI